MPKQNNKSKMAIPSNAKDVAKKLVKLDPSVYVSGKPGREALKKFSLDKHPVLRHDAPNDEAENNDRVFGGKNDKDATTRRADYTGDEDKAAYESAGIRSKLVEKFTKKSRQQPENAQKVGAITPDPEKHFKSDIAAEHESTDMQGSATTQPIPKIKTKLPRQAVVGEGYLTELGDGTAPSPATSDNPGSNSDSSPVNNPDQDSDKHDDQDKNSTETTDSVEKAKEALEYIAMCAAELYEDMPAGVNLPSWVLEKLELSKGFLDSIKEEFGGDKDHDDDEEDGENEGEPAPAAKPTAFKGGEAAMAKESVTRIAQALVDINNGENE